MNSRVDCRSKVVLSATLIGLTLLCQSAFANSTITATYTGSANFGSGQVGYGSGSIAPNPNYPGTSPLTLTGVGVGGDSFTTAPNTYSFTSATGSFNTWCVDITHWLSGGTTTYTLGGASQLASAFGVSGGSRVSSLTKLVDERYSSVNDQTTSAAFQLATWAIMFGTANSPGNYSLNSATFTTSSGITGGALAQTWLSELNTASITGHYGITYLYDGTPGTQSLVTFASTPVPEPETYALMLAGLGLLGFVARRRGRTEQY